MNSQSATEKAFLCKGNFGTNLLNFLIKLLTSNDLVSLLMAIIKILCGIDKMQNKGWLLNCLFLSFCNRKNYSIKNIWVYSKSKIKTKVRSKQNLEHFKIINRRPFIRKFCNN